jgi:hypothetical protein
MLGNKQWDGVTEIPKIAPWRKAMKQKHLAVVTVVLLLVFGVVSSAFCLVEEMNVSKMLGVSDTVVKGKVVATECKGVSDARGNHIYTMVTILAENTLKGVVPGNQLTLEVPGGTVGDLTEAVSDMPTFEAGEEVVLFLKGNPPVVVGGYQGKCAVYDGKVYADNKEIKVGVFLKTIQDAAAKGSNRVMFEDESGLLVQGGGQVAPGEVPPGTKPAEPPQAVVPDSSDPVAGASGAVAAAEMSQASKAAPGDEAADVVVIGQGPAAAAGAPKVQKGAANPPQPTILTATIYNAWWTNWVDIDGDGYKRQAMLNWDPDVAGGAGSLTVFERIYYKAHSSGTWLFFYQSTPHVITGLATSDAWSVGVICNVANYYDFRIDVIRSGMTTWDYSRSPLNDADLNAYRMEPYTSDGGMRVVIYNAWLTYLADYDGDGYKRSLRLNWDANVSRSGGSLTVFERIYVKPYSSTAWGLIYTMPSHVITGEAATDARYLDIISGTARNLYDIRIDVYRSGYSVPDYSCNDVVDPNLNNVGFEPPTMDLKATVYNAWWTNPVDVDGDGFKRSARLNWDPDVVGGNYSLAVYEKIYYKVYSATAYTLLYTKPVHTITGILTTDGQYLDIGCNTSPNYFDFKIEIYRSGLATLDYARMETNDADLNNYKMESAANDTPGGVPIISSISPNKASAGTNAQVVIYGNNFGATQGTSKVEFFYRTGQPKIAATIVSWSNTQIRCVVPIGTVGGYPGSAGSGPVTVTTSAGTSAGYTFRVTFGYGQKRWPGTNPVVNYKINENTADCVSEGLAIRAAANSWNAASSKMTFYYAGTHTHTTASYDSVNEIMWGNITTPGVIAVATYWFSGSNLVETDIVFNDPGFVWNTATPVPTGKMDVQTIALHELGHWLNLRDLYGNVGDGVYDNLKAMYGFGGTGLTKRVLHVDDIAGIIWIYGHI